MSSRAQGLARLPPPDQVLALESTWPWTDTQITAAESPGALGPDVRPKVCIGHAGERVKARNAQNKMVPTEATTVPPLRAASVLSCVTSAEQASIQQCQRGLDICRIRMDMIYLHRPSSRRKETQICNQI